MTSKWKYRILLSIWLILLAWPCRSAYMNLHAYEVEFFKDGFADSKWPLGGLLSAPSRGPLGYETLYPSRSSGLKYAFSIGNGIPRLTKKSETFPIISKVTLAGRNELPEKIDSQDQQQR